MMEISGRKVTGTFRDSIGKGSTEDGELFCTPCGGDDEWVPAAGFCTNCKEHLCSACLKVHRKQSATKNHVIVTGERMPKEQSTAIDQDPCVEPCDRHPTEIIKYFCPEHDIVGCGDCMVLEHKSCKAERVQDESRKFLSTNALSDIKSSVHKFELDLTQLQTEIKENIKSLKEVHGAVISEINKFRKEINDRLDKIRDQLLTEAETLREEDERLLKSLESESDLMKHEIEEFKSKLQLQAKQINSLFVTAKKGSTSLSQFQQHVDTIRKTTQVRKYGFTRNINLQNITNNAKCLGEINRNLDTPFMLNVFDREPSYVGEIVVNSDKDCHFVDCLLVGEKELLVSDFSNNCVKLINLETGTLASTCSFDTIPSGKTVVERGLVAVGLGSFIQLISVNITLTKKQKIKVNGDCFGVACKDDKFAVSFYYPGRVDIIDFHGKVLYRLVPQIGNLNVLERPLCVVFGHEPNTVIVSDWKANKIFTINFKGEIMRTFEDSQLDRPDGLYMMKDGTVLVSNNEKHNILVLYKDWKKAKYILNDNDNVKCPRCIDVCESDNKLYICNANQSVVKIFQY